MVSEQQEVGSLVGDLARALETGEGADLTLAVGGAWLPAHSLLLTFRSPVFAAMLRHDTLEASSRCVEIQDMEEEVARQLLSFIYTDRVPQLTRLAPELLAASDRYDLPLLRQRCEQQLVSGLAVENAAAALVLAVRHTCPLLKERAVQFIRQRLLEVMATEGWQDLCRNPEMVAEVSRLVATSSQSRSESCVPASADSDEGQNPATAGPSTVRHDAPPPDDTAISRLRSLSAKKKARRLMQAAEDGAVSELQALLAAGADVEARLRGRTALHIAVMRGDTEVVRTLLEAGAQVDTREDSQQDTPLHLAADTRHVAALRLLLAHGADPNARSDGGSTPLHVAAIWGHTETVTALLEAGADRGSRDDWGNTPLDKARENDHDLEHILG